MKDFLKRTALVAVIVLSMAWPVAFAIVLGLAIVVGICGGRQAPALQKIKKPCRGRSRQGTENRVHCTTQYSTKTQKWQDCQFAAAAPKSDSDWLRPTAAGRGAA
jgi:hypothetical protein